MGQFVVSSFGQGEAAGARHGDAGGPDAHTGELTDCLEKLLLQVGRGVVGLLLLRDGPADRRPGASPVRQFAVGKGRPGYRPSGAGGGRAVLGDERQSVSDPVAEVVHGRGRELVAAGPALRDGRSPGLGEEVVPRPVEELSGNHVVTLALGHEHGQVGQLSGVCGQVGVEGEVP
jgi:hypothetical protein